MIDFEICTMAEDLKYLLGEGYKKNSLITENQKKYWPQNRILSKELLGRNADNALRLLEEDGLSGETVGVSSKDVTKRYFWKSDPHWPTTMVIIRLGKFLHLDFFQVLLLIIKCQWEKYFLDKEWDGETDIEGTLCYAEEIEKYINQFNLGYTGKFSHAQKGHDENLEADNETVYQLLCDYQYVQDESISFEQLENIVNTIILSKKFLAGIQSEPLEIYIRELKNELKLLQQEGPELKEKFWITKCEYLEKENELGIILYEIENQRLRNENTRNSWYKEFGELVINLLEIENEVILLKKRIELKESNPDLSKKEIEELLKDMKHDLEQKKEQEMVELKEVNWENNEGMELNGDELVDYNQQGRDIIRQIYKHTHTDSPIFVSYDFTERQKEKLLEYYTNAVKIKRREKGNYTVRSVHELMDIWGSIKKLYLDLGYDIVEGIHIKGDTLDEMISYLNKLIEYTEKETRKVKDELDVMQKDPNIKEKSSCLNPKEIIEKVKKGFITRIKQYKEEIEPLTNKWLNYQN